MTNTSSIIVLPQEDGILKISPGHITHVFEDEAGAIRVYLNDGSSIKVTIPNQIADVMEKWLKFVDSYMNR